MKITDRLLALFNRDDKKIRLEMEEARLQERKLSMDRLMASFKRETDFYRLQQETTRKPK